MDEFKPEDELKPDTSDRRPQRPRKASSLSLPKIAVSRQHVMMGTGILVLVLLILGIGSALNSPGKQGEQEVASGGEKTIDLSGSASINGQPQTEVGANTVSPDQNLSPDQTASAPQELNIPQIASSPTEAQPLTTPDNQQRLELPGDLNTALSSQQENIDAASTARSSVGQPAVVHHKPVQQSKPVVQKPAVKESKTALSESKPVVTPRHRPEPKIQAPSVTKTTTQHAGTAVPGSRYTLQLSSASRSDTLNAWAKKQNLSNYRVYQTTRDGQPWYVLISGSYSTTSDAKRAIASLPAGVQAQKPWIKPVSQVQKEAGK